MTQTQAEQAMLRADAASAVHIDRVRDAIFDELVLRRQAASNAASQTFASWATTGGFIADREPINLVDWTYLREIYESVPANPVDWDGTIMKSAQGGASVFAMLLSMWLLLTRRCQGAYFLPTKDHAMAFSGERFIRMARDNPVISKALGEVHDEGDEGSKSIRRFMHSILYFTYMGGKVTTESLPLDYLIFDEVQVMSLKVMETALERISASPLRLLLRLSTANFEGADIHYFFQRSDQREWHVHCGCPDGVVLTDHWDAKAGPLCIREPHGKVRTEPYFWCPRCELPLDNVRAGTYHPRNPGVKRMGWHFPQFLSPRWTAGMTLDAWRERIDTKNFYNRKLGLPYTDPETQPITEAMLANAQDVTLPWVSHGYTKTEAPDAVFAGIDQMGHDNRIIVATPHGDRMRVVHAEIVQAGDPWVRCGAIMKDYRVSVCAVEALPNYNEAHRFARDFDGKVFIVHYADLIDQLVLWGDRPREKVTVRKTDEDAKARWTATVDQYKMMSWALGQWTEGRVVTPDARTLVQTIKTERGPQTVAVLRDQVWLHLQRVALVTEQIQGREDERKFRRAVRKVGIDPHFAYTWMLLCVAWVRRFGTDFMLPIDRTDLGTAMAGGAVPMKSGEGDQLRRAFPVMETTPAARERDGLVMDTCGVCVHYDGAGKCQLRRLNVTAALPGCDGFVSRLEDDDAD